MLTSNLPLHEVMQTKKILLSLIIVAALGAVVLFLVKGNINPSSLRGQVGAGPRPAVDVEPSPDDENEIPCRNMNEGSEGEPLSCGGICDEAGEACGLLMGELGLYCECIQIDEDDVDAIETTECGDENSEQDGLQCGGWCPADEVCNINPLEEICECSPCAGFEESCSDGGDCCDGFCNGETCECSGFDGPCDQDEDCCSDFCDYGRTRCGCFLEGTVCSIGDECCGECVDGECTDEPIA